jgi:hypothetical protein|tara:strand:- start:1225 stop:6012 length:4788 start_codon:yes stop_codon:yes gene_type:complete
MEQQDRKPREPLAQISGVGIGSSIPLPGTTDQAVRELVQKEAAAAGDFGVEKDPLTLEEFLESGADSIGGKPIRSQVLDRARNGSKRDLAALSDLIAAENRKAGTQAKFANIPLTRVDPTTEKRVVSIPEGSLSKREPILGLFGQSEYEAGVEYAQNRIKLNEAIKGHVVDPRVQELLSDYYQTGFLRQFGFDTEDFLKDGVRFPTTAVIYSKYLAPAFVSAVKASSSNDPEAPDFNEAFSIEFNKVRPMIAQEMAGVKRRMKNKGLSPTFGDGMNDFFIKKYIEKYGEDEFMDNYRPFLNEETGDRLYIPLITDEAADAILDYGFGELSTLEQFASFAVPNTLISNVLAGRHIRLGKRQLEKYEDLKKKGLIPERDLQVPPRVALANYEINNTAGKFGYAYRKFRGNIGNLMTRRFGYEGKIADARTVVERERSLERVSKQIQHLDTSIGTAQANGIRGTSKIRVMGDDKKYVEMTLDEAIERRNFLNNRFDSLNFNRGIGKFLPKDVFKRAVFADEMIVTAGQTFGYSYIPAMFGPDWTPEGGAAVGAITTAIFGRPVARVTGFVAGGLGNVTGVKPAAVATARFFEDLHLLPRGLIVNRKYEDIAEALGGKLNADDLAAFGKAANILENLSEEGLDAVYKSLEQYGKVRSRVLKQFDNEADRKSGAYDEAVEAFSLSFAYASGLAPLQAFEQARIGKFGIKNLSKAVDVQLEAENSLKAAQLGMDKLAELMSKKAGVNIQDSGYLAEYVRNFNAAADGLQRNIGDRRREYLELLEKYKSDVMANPGSKEASATLKDLVDLEIKLTPGAMEDVEIQRGILVSAINTLGEKLDAQVVEVQRLKGTPAYDREIGRLAEELVDLRDQKIELLGRQVYETADKLLGDKTVDLAPIMEEMINRLAEMNQSGIKQFFGADSAFFRGRSGKYARAAMERIAETNLRKVFGDDFNEFIQRATTREVLTADGKIVPNKSVDDGGIFVGEDASYSEIAFAFYRSQSEAGEKFDPFAAGAFDADELYRHLRNEGERIAKSQGDEAAKPYRDLMIIIDDQISNIPGAENVLNDTRKRYKELKFDPIQSEGSYGDVVSAATSRTDLEKPGVYRRRYGVNEMPHTWHNKIGRSASRAVSYGTRDDFNDFALEMDGFNRYWADDIDYEGDEPIYVFDMRLPYNDEASFRRIGQMLRNGIQSRWGDEVNDEVLAKIKLDRLGKVKVDDEGISGSYNFKRVENVRELKENIRIKVIDEEGNEIDTYWFDMEDMITAETDIVDLVETDAAARKAYEEFVEKLNRSTGRLADEGRESLDIEGKAVSQMQKAADTMDPLQFYENYVVNYDATLFEALRDRFVTGIMRENEGMTEAEALQSFKRGTIYMVTNGLLKRAGTRAEGTYKYFDGSQRTINTMINPVTLLGDLEDKNIEKTLRLVLEDDDHYTFLRDMAEMLLYAEGRSLERFTPQGIVRGISPNEIISRAFNIARGMVSPTYVGAEFAFRMLQDMEVSAFQLAAENKEANRIMLLLLDDPKLVSEADVRTLSTIVLSVTSREYIRRERRADSFVPQDEVQAAIEEMQLDSDIGLTDPFLPNVFDVTEQGFELLFGDR